jgi:hypothetical protein
MAHVDPPSARSPETQKERLTQLIAQWREQAAGWRRCARAETRFTGGRTDADARAHEYSACADQLEAALAADPGQGEPPQDEEVERYLAALPWSRNAHRNGTKSTTEENIRTFVRWLRGELPGIAAPARTVQAEPAPQPATTRIVHSSEIADDPGGFEGDYVPLEDHRAAIASRSDRVRASPQTADDLDRTLPRTRVRRWSRTDATVLVKRVLAALGRRRFRANSLWGSDGNARHSCRMPSCPMARRNQIGRKRGACWQLSPQPVRRHPPYRPRPVCVRPVFALRFVRSTATKAWTGLLLPPRSLLPPSRKAASKWLTR